MYGLKGLSLSEVITTVLAPFNTQYMNDVQVSRQFSNIRRSIRNTWTTFKYRVNFLTFLPQRKGVKKTNCFWHDRNFLIPSNFEGKTNLKSKCIFLSLKIM